jgi:hypothetical protein
MGEICTVCKKECRGGFEVYEREQKDGTFEVVIDTTPDRNYNICDVCNVAICFDCSINRDSGYFLILRAHGVRAVGCWGSMEALTEPLRSTRSTRLQRPTSFYALFIAIERSLERSGSGRRRPT